MLAFLVNAESSLKAFLSSMKAPIGESKFLKSTYEFWIINEKYTELILVAIAALDFHPPVTHF